MSATKYCLCTLAVEESMVIVNTRIYPDGLVDIWAILPFVQTATAVSSFYQHEVYDSYTR